MVTTGVNLTATTTSVTPVYTSKDLKSEKPAVVATAAAAVVAY